MWFLPHVCCIILDRYSIKWFSDNFFHKTVNQSEFSATNKIKEAKWQKGEDVMIEFDKDFEKQCEMYLGYLYEQAEHLYSDCTELDVLVQDSLMVLIIKQHKIDMINNETKIISNKFLVFLIIFSPLLFD